MRMPAKKARARSAAKAPPAHGSGKAWQRMGRMTGKEIAALVQPVYVCDRCGAWQGAKKPRHCMDRTCGSIAFTFFASEGEAKRWARLQLAARAKQIDQLERQVSIPLLTVDRDGKPVEWAKWRPDFRYRVISVPGLLSGTIVHEDFKPENLLTPEGALKIRCAEAMGFRVVISTEKGIV